MYHDVASISQTPIQKRVHNVVIKCNQSLGNLIKNTGENYTRKRARISRLEYSSFFKSHAPNRPRRSATADNALAVLRTGAAVAVAVAVAVTAALLAAFFTDFDLAATAERRG